MIYAFENLTQSNTALYVQESSKKRLDCRECYRASCCVKCDLAPGCKNPLPS